MSVTQVDRRVRAGGGLDYQLGSYGISRLRFRGPRSALDRGQVAFVGGTETFGKFIERPFPALVAERTGMACINFGIVNAGLDAHLGDSAVMAACHDAALTVIEVTGAHNLTNRLYRVHPRRNDRFVRASPRLRELYPEVDFADFAFTRHMLAVLRATCAARFEVVRAEAQRVWVHRMREFARELPVQPLVLWFADRPPGAAEEVHGAEPLFVTRAMLEEIRPAVRGILEICPTPEIRARGRDRMVHAPGEAMAAAMMLGPGAHEAAAAALAAELGHLLRGDLAERLRRA
ncbi:DUF6473 family protein [Histidinibacterium lentulum]|uniref:DUF6473 family protein n=1 Tax=Histidinibacterium lentulum TaxID=2480588 RepID=UPI00161915EE|nr:DUF6473 family protein [Histidinibacterium lentulum]